MASSLHIGGMASGTDYNSMVDQLVAAKRVPIQKLENEQVELDYDLGAWSEVKSLATTLTSSLDRLRGYELWNGMDAESTFESVLTATAASGSAEQSYTVSVTNLATAQSISSDLIDTSSDLITAGYSQEGDIFEIEGQQITIEAGETLSSLRNKINSAALSMSDENRVQASIVNNHLVLTREQSGEGSISLTDVTGSSLRDLGVLEFNTDSITSNTIDTTNDLITGGYVAQGDVFDIEGQQITIDAGETLSTLSDKINAAALLMPAADRVQASIVDDQLVLTREQAGGSITLSDVTGTALQGLGMLEYDTAIKNERVVGESAEFTVNGIAVTRSSNTELKDVVEGVTLNLQSEGTSTLKISPDRDQVKDALLEFIDAYNVFAAKVDEYSSIENGGSSDMAMKGELYGDTLLSTIRSGLRRLATASMGPGLDESNASYNYDGKDGVMDTLSDIGIWTSNEINQLSVIDEDRLNDMLEYEFENMEQLFKGVYNEEAVAYQDGVASDFYRYMSGLSDPLTGDIDLRIKAMTEDYDELSERIREMEYELVDYEQDQWDEFTFMEDALAQMEYQQNYLEQVFSTK